MSANVILESANRKIKKLLDEGKDPSSTHLTPEEKKELFLSLAGAWKDKPEMDVLFKKILDDRKNFKLRY